MMRLITLIILLLISLPNVAYGNQDGNRILDLSIQPEKVLFDITNMKPGDSATRKLTLDNGGDKDFNYLFSVIHLDGSEKLYNELSLKILTNSELLFDGRIEDFTRLESRLLSSQSREDLTITIGMPFELGNEFQGLETQVQFKFYVEGTLGGILPVNGPHFPVELPVAMTTFFLGGLASLLTVFLRKRK